MTRAFTDKENEVIKKTLLKTGREMFATLGLKKTGVAELTRAAGIAQGSFYNFYGSKEELFFALMEEEERLIQAKFSQLLSGELTKEKLKLLLVEGLAVAESNTIIKQMMDPEIYQKVVRKLPSEKIQQHIENDSDNLAPLISHWQEAGQMQGLRPQVVSGLLRATFMIALHKQEIGEDIYPEVVELLAELLSAGLVKEGSE